MSHDAQRVWQRRVWFLAAVSMLFAVGCAPQVGLQYSDSADLAKLPERHQEQVRQYLTQYFGTPEEPRLRVPAPANQPVTNQPPAGQQAGASDEAVEETVPQVPLVDKLSVQHLKHGAEVYRERCAGCHGITGDGQGTAAPHLDPKPRDYRQGKFKFTSTPRGSKPRRADLVRVLRRGAKGTSMPDFRWLPEEDLQAVIDYVMVLSQRGELEAALIRDAEFELDEEDNFDPEIVAEYATTIGSSWEKAADQLVLPATPPPDYTDESILAGAKVFVSRECAKCHGADGRGGRQNFKPEDTPKDDWGHVAFAADLTSGMLHGGRRPVDIYRRIYSGINGTPMPGFSEAFRDEPETIWHLVHFVTSLVEGREVPEVQKLLREGLPSPGAAESPVSGEASATE
ncbi:MAG: c-type cytochrome [Pirellulaceae bacterium]|nr:c-type cytochrome [Pirellulaceae bacterium]